MLSGSARNKRYNTNITKNMYKASHTIIFHIGSKIWIQFYYILEKKEFTRNEKWKLKLTIGQVGLDDFELVVVRLASRLEGGLFILGTAGRDGRGIQVELRDAADAVILRITDKW